MNMARVFISPGTGSELVRRWRTADLEEPGCYAAFAVASASAEAMNTIKR